jgi:type VI secretion system secreted protein Hcp
MQACCTGKHFDKTLLTLRKAGTTPLDYVVIELENCIITNVSTGGSDGEETLTETVSLNFNKFTYKYQPQDKTGAAKGGSIDVEYDIAINV